MWFRTQKSFEDAAPHEVAGQLELGEVRVIDVREPHEFCGELGHLDNAELVPLSTLSRELPAWPKDAPLLVVCRSGARSRRAASVLANAGFSKVTNLSGGMMSWRRAGLEVGRC